MDANNELAYTTLEEYNYSSIRHLDNGTVIMSEKDYWLLIHERKLINKLYPEFRNDVINLDMKSIVLGMVLGIILYLALGAVF